MDALPVLEENSVDYVSQVAGKMHACGHDGHVAIGLTVAKLLTKHRDQIRGTIKLAFQPAEEGLGGAEAMIDDGLLADPVPDIAYALHLWNEKPVGWLGVSPGPVMSASDIFRITLRGRGGHGALPHQTIDPVVAAAQVVTGLQTIVSRNVAPLKSAVVSVTRIEGGDTYNVIPPSVELQGTIRTFDPEIREIVIGRFNQVVNGISTALGCRGEISVDVLTPALVNEPGLTTKLQSIFHTVFPNDLIETSFQTMGSEDMAYILQTIPGCYFFVGSANADLGLDYGHHHPKFNFDEQVLPKAVTLMTEATMKTLAL